MLNEKGSSYLEALLTLSILLALTSVLPIVNYLKHSLYNKTLELHASEVAYEALKIVQTKGEFVGKKQIENTEYVWEFDGETICVKFQNLDEERRKCINREGEF